MIKHPLTILSFCIGMTKIWRKTKQKANVIVTCKIALATKAKIHFQLINIRKITKYYFLTKKSFFSLNFSKFFIGTKLITVGNGDIQAFPNRIAFWIWLLVYKYFLFINQIQSLSGFIYQQTKITGIPPYPGMIIFCLTL